MTPVEELRAAAAKLRDPLPGDLAAAPRLVMSDAETISAVAFCVEPMRPTDHEPEVAACDNCEVVDCLHEKLAELVLALLTSREPLAEAMEYAARAADRIGPGHRKDASTGGAFLAVARVINGGA